jgi:uncharacterized membrane protein YqhA
MAVALIGAFFLPIFKLEGSSAFNIVTAPEKGKDMLMKYIWILIAISAIILLAGALNNENYVLGRSLWAWLPLATLIFVVVKVYLIAKESSDKVPIGDFVKIFAVGFWIMFAASLILAFSWSRPR